MSENEKERLARQYAAGEITWRGLRERGFDNYVEVLGKHGELSLRPPLAPMTGPNVEARRRGRAMIRKALEAEVSKPCSLIVADTSPLFTQVLAGSLDILLRPGLPGRIPDRFISR